MVRYSYNNMKVELQKQLENRRRRRDRVRVGYGGTVLFGEGELVGENVEASVDLHGIGVDYFEGEVGGQING